MHLLIKINPSGQALVIYFDQKMNSSLVINALGLNRPWASSLFYIGDSDKDDGTNEEEALMHIYFN